MFSGGVRLLQRTAAPAASVLAAGAAWAGSSGVADTGPVHAAAESEPSPPKHPTPQPSATPTPTGGPFYTRAEIAKHATEGKSVWVTYGDGVYDVTKFVASHPGGRDKIMLAAGKAVDPFWRIYRAHLRSDLAPDLLKRMRIGTLDPNEPPTVVDSSDPYASDPDRHPGLIFHNDKPCNAELPPALQMQDWVTPVDLWYIRHHHPVPMIDAGEWRLNVSGAAVRSISLTYDDLRHRFPKTVVTATIQCGGNRRSGMDEVEKTAGISWGTGAISTARFGGVLLRDVLVHSGLLTSRSAKEAGVHHIVFKGADGMEASVPVEKALGEYGDALLAYEMNGEPLPYEHGYPLRAVMPGHVGVRNVKWLTAVVASAEEAEGPWQRGIAYKGFSPNVKSFEGIDVESVLSIQEMPVQSVIVAPAEGEVVELDASYFPSTAPPSRGDEDGDGTGEGDDGEDDELDTISMSGWAWSGGGRCIVRVDVSADGGTTWHTAKLGEGSEQPPNRAWAWTFWEANVPVPKGAGMGGVGKDGRVELVCRATDASYNVQPERAKPFWNKRGLNNNSWHRVFVRATPDDTDVEEEVQDENEDI